MTAPSRIISPDERQRRLAAIEPRGPGLLPLVSVVIASYNNPHNLTLCLESIHQQLYPNWEAVVSDDGSDNPLVEEVAHRYGAVWVTKPHNYIDGKPVKHISRVLNQGVEASSGFLIQTLQQDHVLAPDFLLWLVRAHVPRSLIWGLTDHRSVPMTLEDVALMPRVLHLPDGEIRYATHLMSGRTLLQEVQDWHNTDGLDCTFTRSDWLPWDEHPDMIGQSHSWVDWVLQMMVHSNRLLINPMMRLWHLEHEQMPDQPVWQAQLERSYKYLQGKWDPSIWNAQIQTLLYDVREYRDRVLS